MKQLIYVACAAALLLAGCGGGTTSNPMPKQQPTSWTLQAGGSDQNEALQALQFYPSTITVDVGDSITWKYPAGEPHTVTFLGPKASPPPPTDPSDSAPAGGTTYDGTTYTSSGFVLGGKTYTLTFSKAGTYKYYCLIHGEMVGTVVVQPAGTAYPISPGSVDAQISTLLSTDLQAAGNSVANFPYTAGGPHLVAGISPGLGAAPPTSASVVRFLDGDSLSDTSVSVAAGSTVTWTNLDSNLPHTVTFAPAGAAFPTLNPFSPPSGGNTYDGTTLVNSGPLFGGKASA